MDDYYDYYEIGGIFNGGDGSNKSNDNQGIENINVIIMLL